jgi:pseudaminic acid biosynthesis-associated methylase
MNSKYKTPQEEFWAGEFGDDYTDRNTQARWVASNMALFTKILARTAGVESVLELGANRGLNLLALKQLLPDASFFGVEINRKAAAELERLGFIKVYHSSILDFVPVGQSSLVLIKGVLIHLNPAVLEQVYELIMKASARYICVAEYYNPTPVAITYRGHSDKLFKRDFAGEIMAKHPSLRLIDYGFSYHGDPNFPQDDLTWFLFEKPLAHVIFKTVSR